MTNLTGNHGGLFRKTTASGLVCLLLVACAAAAAAAESCKGWKTAKFFESATLQQVRACLSAGEDPNEPDTQGRTALHRAARETRDPAGDRGVAGCGRQPEVDQYSRQAALGLRADERQDQRLGRLSAALDSGGEGSEEGVLVQGAGRAARYKDRGASVQGRSSPGKPEDQGPFRLGGGGLHHPGAQGWANAHRAEAGRAQGAHPPTVLETKARVDRAGSYARHIVSEMD